MSAYLSASELADLIGCKPNQRTAMRRWLDKYQWPYAVDRSGLPKVTHAYHDARMTGDTAKVKEASQYASEPNREAFIDVKPNFDLVR